MLRSKTTRRQIALALALVTLLFARVAAGDVAPESIRFTLPITCQAEGAEPIDLDPGRYLREDLWQGLDSEIQILQNDRTRLRAENQALRDYSEPTPWILIGLAFGAGALGAYYISD